MKIAIVLSGHLRSFRNTFPSFQKLKNTLQSIGEVDTFCHTWDIEESISASWWKDHSPNTIPVANVKESEVIDLYKPVASKIEPSKNFTEPSINIRSIIPISGLLSMLYSQHAAYLLMDDYSKSKNISYDIVIKTRYDLEYEIANNFMETLQREYKSGLLIPSSNSFELIGGCADIFAAGNYQDMSEYLKLYERFENVLDHYQNLTYKELIPELFLRTYLDLYKIPNAESEGIRFTILRTNGNRLTINSDKHFTDNEPNCFFKETIDRYATIFENSRLPAQIGRKVNLKYLNWMDSDAPKEELDVYLDFYHGKWIGAKRLERLVHKTKDNKTLNEKTLTNFFKRAMSSAEYSWSKKVLFATIMWKTGNYGFHFFKIIGKDAIASVKR